MSIVDVNAILNGTPDKRITLAYQNMKDTYNEESANDFFNVYTKESLSSILDNSEYIFSENYKGTEFYKNIVLDESSCIFTRYDDEINKVENFIKENASNMEDNQKDIFNNLLKDMKDFREAHSDIIIVASYINENENGEFEKTLSNYLYEEAYDKSIDLLKNADKLYTKFVYAPFIVESVNFNKRGELNEYIIEEVSGDYNYDTYVETAIVMNKAGACEDYNNALRNFGNTSAVFGIRSWLIANPIPSNVQESLTVTDREVGAVIHEDSNDAVNSLFDDITEAALFEDSDKAKKEFANKVNTLAYEKTMDLLIVEAGFVEDDDSYIVHGYKMLGDNTSLSFDKAYGIISEKCSMTEGTNDFFESSDEDEDDDIDGSLNDLASSYDDNDSSKSDSKEKSSNKSHVTNHQKLQKPKAKNLATKVQTKAQDLEVKQMGAASKFKQKAEETKRAAKAVAALPLNVINEIKHQIAVLDEKDIESRKAYMTQPGYRKKAFRNVKLAIMYGSAAQIKLSLVPMLAVVRHFSKKKDARIRAELERELATEIKVCDAKIEDAQNNNDSKEKYRLIRLRDQLEAERMRVIVNSKKM